MSENKPNSNGNVSLIFPKEFPKTVFIRRKKVMAGVPGQNQDDANLKIGSSFRGNSVLRGLTFEEEVKYLPAIIGISPDSPNWETKTREYWANISKSVPPGDGVELQVGLKYVDKTAYEYDSKLAKNNNGIIIDHKGTPINIADYILWRYCLEYSRVANNIDDINKSPKIDFYLYSKDKEIFDKKSILNNKRKALQLLYKQIGEREWVNYILRVLVAQDKNPAKISVQQLSTLGEDEKDILVEQYAESNPVQFCALAEDKNLELRAFIELAIATNKLTRIPNTNTITLDNSSIGNSVEEVIAFLTDAKNAEIYATLKAQIKFTT